MSNPRNVKFKPWPEPKGLKNANTDFVFFTLCCISVVTSIAIAGIMYTLHFTKYLG